MLSSSMASMHAIERHLPAALSRTDTSCFAGFPHCTAGRRCGTTAKTEQPCQAAAGGWLHRLSWSMHDGRPLVHLHRQEQLPYAQPQICTLPRLLQRSDRGC